jgi:hypothetical protein
MSVDRSDSNHDEAELLAGMQDDAANLVVDSWSLDMSMCGSETRSVAVAVRSWVGENT